MTSDQGPVVQSALLRSELVRLRKDKGLTQQQVAAELAWSPSKIIRIEGGHSSITQVDLDALLGRYGRTADKERERLQTLNRDARKKGWWDRYREVISADYLDYVGYESGAASVRQFQGSVVPGLLQTREYAEVLTANSVEDEDKASRSSSCGSSGRRAGQAQGPAASDLCSGQAVIRGTSGSTRTRPSCPPNSSTSSTGRGAMT